MLGVVLVAGYTFFYSFSTLFKDDIKVSLLIWREKRNW